MSFRKGPFHFGEIDPAKRREELLKRFGLRSDDGHNMFYETSPMGSNWPDWQGRMPRRAYFEEPEWRTRQGSFSQSGSTPGSPHFPRSGMSMPHTPSWLPDDEAIPIKVVREKSAPSRTTDDSAESDSSSHSSQSTSSQKRSEPRVHHIPIMVEPRDGSASSGYASCDEAAKTPNAESHQEAPSQVSQSPQDAELKRTRPNVQNVRMNFEPEKTVNGASHSSASQPSPSMQDHFSPKSSPLSSPQPMGDTSPLGAKAKVHTIPIKIESEPRVRRSSPLRSQSANVRTVGGQSPSRPVPVNRSASSPVNGQFRSTSRGANCGKANQTKQGASAPCSPSASGGPYVTRIPVNVENGGGHSQSRRQPRDDGCTTDKASGGMSAPPSSTASPAKSPSGPLEKIAEIRKDLEMLRRSVEEFKGMSGDKEYRYLDEMLTRCMLRLDDIETGGKDEIRQARKACVNEVHQCVALLEAKGKAASAGEKREEKPAEKIEEDSKIDEQLKENEKQEASTAVSAEQEEAMQVDENKAASEQCSAEDATKTQSADTAEEMQVEVDQKEEKEMNDSESQMQVSEESGSTSQVPAEAAAPAAAENTKPEETQQPAVEASESSTNSSMPRQSEEMMQDATTNQKEQVNEDAKRPIHLQEDSEKSNQGIIHRSEVTVNVSEPEEPSDQQTQL